MRLPTSPPSSPITPRPNNLHLNNQNPSSLLFLNIHTLTHADLYSNDLSLITPLDQWINSINTTITNPVIRMTVAFLKLDREILERLKLYNLDIYTLTWDDLIEDLKYFRLGYLNNQSPNSHIFSNIRTLTYTDLYVEDTSPITPLNQWINSIVTTIVDPVTKMTVALQKLDEEILGRLRRDYPDIHTLTWNDLTTKLHHFMNVSIAIQKLDEEMSGRLRRHNPDIHTLPWDELSNILHSFMDPPVLSPNSQIFSNIRTLTHTDIYVENTSSITPLDQWIDSIATTIDDPATKMAVALQKLDEEILGRLRRHYPDIHTLTWDELATKLQSFIEPPEFDTLLSELYAQRYTHIDALGGPSSYFTQIHTLRTTILSKYPDRHDEIPSLKELITISMVYATKNPWRHILSDHLNMCGDHLDIFLVKFSSMSRTIPLQDFLCNPLFTDLNDEDTQ